MSTYELIPPPPIVNPDGTTTVNEPPRETGEFLPPDLVELKQVDARLRLDVRYATPHNFTGEQVYSQARAFMQRPAATALVRAHDDLLALGYGLLIYDGYRPWSVTKRFWDVTPLHQKEFVADPATGSRHNRGCATDLSLFHLQTGQPVEMPSDYDEFNEKAYPTYEGGTPESRRLRDLLRRVMEAHGFSVYRTEWWHFDYPGWEQYRIMDIPFEDLI